MTKKRLSPSRLRLADMLIADMLALPKETLLSEFKEEYGSPEKNSEGMRALFEKSVITANKCKLISAKSGLAAQRGIARSPTSFNMAEAKQRLRQILASCTPEMKLTFAARKENELSDADVLGMLEDLEELGICPMKRDDTSK